jgi:hypothetical protein
MSAVIPFAGGVNAAELAKKLKDPTISGERLQAEARKLALTNLDGIEPLPVEWLWRPRIAAGMFGLFAGREGLGKSMIAAWLMAQVTKGTLDGYLKGTPKTVVLCATEDSYAHTIVPRLMAAGANLKRIARVDVTEHNTVVDLVLPTDLVQLEAELKSNDVALVVLDPLMSRLSPKLDTHKDADVRRALEPLVKLAHNTGASVLGLIHTNKGSSSDANNLIMGSRAFSAVSRYTLMVEPDAANPTGLVLGQPKNSVGPSFNLPVLPYRIQSELVASSDLVRIETAKVVWSMPDTTRTFNEVLKANRSEGDRGKQRDAAADWLRGYLESQPTRSARPQDVYAAGLKAGHAERTLKRARKGIGVRDSGGGPKTVWELPEVEF